MISGAPDRIRIGIVGVGGVARYAHIPSYLKRGLVVSAVCDQDPAVAAVVAAEAGGAAVVVDAAALARRGDVDVIDVATPPGTHVGLLRELAGAGKPILMQKPLCTCAAELEEIRRIGAAEDPWVRLNLTGRHVSAWRTVADLLFAGEIGLPFLCTIRNRDWWDRGPGRWDHGIEHYIVHEMAIHHLDLLRHWFGPPRRVTARGGAHPRQQLRRANWLAALVEYGSDVVVNLVEDWTMPEFSFATGHPFEEVLISGERGVIRATSERVELSRPEEDLLRVWHLPRPGQVLPGQHLDTGWFPDSFGAAMAAFQSDIAGDPGRKAADWAHLIAVTDDALAVAAALDSGDWIERGVERP